MKKNLVIFSSFKENFDEGEVKNEHKNSGFSSGFGLKLNLSGLHAP